MAETQTPTIKPKLASLCKELVGLLGLRQGSVEIHCDKAKPTRLNIIDKSIKFEDEHAQ